MQPLEWERRPDGLRAPAIVCAFKGWNDAGDAASTAVQFVGTSLGATRFASIDPEEFYDFQSTRPQVRVDETGVRDITWPVVEVFEARVPRAPRDLVLIVGHEPSMRWRGFCQLVIDLAEALGAQLVVSLGALLADVAHTRPIAVTGVASDRSLVDRLDLLSSSYEGPTGIVGVLQAQCGKANLPAASLWAAVPHYIAANTNPAAALALVRQLEGILDVHLHPDELESASEVFMRQIQQVLESDEETAAYVRELERRDTDEDDEDEEIPTGDELAEELQRFLRERRERPDEPD